MCQNRKDSSRLPQETHAILLLVLYYHHYLQYGDGACGQLWHLFTSPNALAVVSKYQHMGHSILL